MAEISSERSAEDAFALRDEIDPATDEMWEWLKKTDDFLKRLKACCQDEKMEEVMKAFNQVRFYTAQMIFGLVDIKDHMPGRPIPFTPSDPSQFSPCLYGCPTAELPRQQNSLENCQVDIVHF